MKRILLFAAAYLLLAPPPPLRAQQFPPSNNPDILIPHSDSSENINQIFNYSVGNAIFGSSHCDLYVSSWSSQPYSTSQRFYYKRTLINDPTNILDQGLVKVPNASIIYGAVILNKPYTPSQYCVAVVYGSGPSGGGIAFFEWTSSGLTLMNQYTQTFATTDWIGSMRIDAVGLSYYTVVYTVNPNTNMYAFGGDVTGTYYPLVGSVKQIQGNSSAGSGGYLPDVAMIALSNPPANMQPTGIKLYFSYISPDKQNCLVSYLGFSELMAGSSPISLNYEHTIPQITPPTLPPLCNPGYYPCYYFSRGPIIDAPDYGNDSWAVIVEQDKNALSSGPCIFGAKLKLQVNASYKYNGGSIQDKILNDASLPGIPLAFKMSENTVSPYNNYLYLSQPAVAFSPLAQTINFAWGITQQNAAMGGSYDYLGMDFNPSTNNYIGAPYRIIDQNPAITTAARAIAFSGNNIMQPEDLYTVFSGVFNNPGRQEVFQKHPEWTAIAGSGYKPTNIEVYGQNNLKANALPNPFDHSFRLTIGVQYQNDILEMSMRDILGREICSAKGNIESINQNLHQFLTKNPSLNTGMYFLHLKAAKTGEESTLKIIKQ